MEDNNYQTCKRNNMKNRKNNLTDKNTKPPKKSNGQKYENNEDNNIKGVRDANKEVSSNINNEMIIDNNNEEEKKNNYYNNEEDNNGDNNEKNIYNNGENSDDNNEETFNDIEKNNNNIINNFNEINNIKAVGLKNFDYEEIPKGWFYKYYEYKIKTGNICYMNSSIQCLFHLKDFTDNISNIKYKKPLTEATSDLINEMKNFSEKGEKNKKNKEALSVEKIKNEMGKIDTRYFQNNQEDANEFISNFLEGLLDENGDKESLPKPLELNDKDELEAYNKFYNRFYKLKGNSFLLDLFYVILKTQKECNRCSKKIIKFNAYNIIELPIYELAKKKRNKELDFKEILQNFFEENKNIDGKCKYCGSSNIYELTNLYELSKYLIFYFGRTVDDEYISNNIFYPVRDNFGKYLFKKTEIKYNITGVIYYSKLGNKSGHYTASCLCDDGWYYFNDTNVRKIKNENIYGKPIILIYKRI